MLKEIKSYRERIEIKLWLIREKRYREKIRKFLNNKDFSIISSNCWGGGIYETFGLPYKTPTVGLFFFAPCYINFLRNLELNLQSKLEFIEISKYETANKIRIANPYPLGLINGEIEVHFQHYSSKEEALEKWLRRAKRVNFENLFLAFNDRDLCTKLEIDLFDKFPYKKVFFSSKNIPGCKSIIWLKEFMDKDCVGDLYSEPWTYRKHFDVLKWLNN